MDLDLRSASELSKLVYRGSVNVVVVPRTMVH